MDVLRAPWDSLTPEDLAALEGDAALRDRYVEVYSTCIIPCYVEAADTFKLSRHLMDEIGFGHLAPFAMSGVSDIAEKFTDNLWLIFYEFCAFAQSWTPLLRRCAHRSGTQLHGLRLRYHATRRRWQQGQFDRLAPARACPLGLVFLTLGVMTVKV